MHKDNKMPRRQRRAYEMHSKTDDYKRNISIAKNNIREILSNPLYKPVIEYSGGKDSIVLTNLIMEQDNTIPVWNYHPGYSQTYNQMFRSYKTHNELLKTLDTLKKKPVTVYVANEPRLHEKMIKYWDALFDYMDKYNLNLELLGIRGEESSNRRNRVKTDLVHIEGIRVVSFPLRHLTVDDVWAYIITNDIYYTSHYDKYGPIYGWDNVRFTSHFNNNEIVQYYFDKILCFEDTNIRPQK